MGCWYETDFVTREPIFEGDEAAMVVLKDLPYRDLWNGGLYKQVERIEFGKYNDYGWIEGLEGATSPKMALRAAGKDEPYERAIFTRRDTWDTLKANSPESTEFELRQYKIDLGMGWVSRPDPISDELLVRIGEFASVLGFCREVRADPLGGLSFKGSQSWCDKAYKKLAKMTAEASKRITKRMASDED